MKAVVTYPGRKFFAELRSVPEPVEQDDEILVRVLELGIDGTDRDIYAGEYGEPPAGSDYLVIGHESLGEIASIGKNARASHPEFKPGDLVVATVRRPDGCPNCLAGEMDMCLRGEYTERGIKGRHGYLSEFYSERPEFLVTIPPELRSIAVLLEPVSVVEKAISQAWRIQTGRMHWEPKTALVLGAGPIGLLAAMILRLKGIRTVVYSRESQEDPRVALLRQTGAEYLSASQTPLRKIPDALGRIDFILEATGSGEMAIHAFDLIGENGVLVLTSISSQKRKLEICPDCTNLKLVLGNRLVFGSVNANRRDFISGVEHLRQARQRFPNFLESFISRRVKLEDFKLAIDKIPGEMKSVIEVGAEL